MTHARKRRSVCIDVDDIELSDSDLSDPSESGSGEVSDEAPPRGQRRAPNGLASVVAVRVPLQRHRRRSGSALRG